jgi:hypothetical protein
MQDDIFIKLKDFVIRQAGIGEDEELITRDTQIEDDLGVTGGDAVDFMLAYGNTFKVDLTKFMAADYFGAERNVILSELLRWFTRNRKRERKVLTVGHLEKGILKGYLDEEVINSNS